MPDLAVIYSTFGSIESARAAASILVDERLLACANLLPGALSIYRWEGAVHADPEIVLIGKTRSDLVASAIERLRNLHPYETPCITSWPIATSSESYGAWIKQATGAES
jgi:periplasmic divalent cation tolerance protein